jgi:hypothetical protein
MKRNSGFHCFSQFYFLSTSFTAATLQAECDKNWVKPVLSNISPDVCTFQVKALKLKYIVLKHVTLWRMSVRILCI